jgi:hypothetical protein
MRAVSEAFRRAVLEPPTQDEIDAWRNSDVGRLVDAYERQQAELAD